MTVPEYDVVIAGGGMVGASLACALAPLGLRVAVVEAVSAQAAQQPSFDDRGIALSLGSQRIFATLGLWPALAPAATAIKTIHVSDRGRFGVTRLQHQDYAVAALGYVMTSRDMGAVLQQQLTRQAGIALLCPARVVAVTTDSDLVRVSVAQDGDGQRQLTARLLVAADGGDSRVRAMLGISVREQDYLQDAVIANVSTSRRHQQTAYERFTASGPLALLPLSQGRSAVVWTRRREQTPATLALDDAAFCAQLQEQFGWRLGAFTRAGRRAAYPLRLLRVSEPQRQRALVIGNAAHSLHPIAGQGFNLGLRDVAVLAEVLAEAAAGGDVGAPAVLARFVERQGRDQRQTALLTDGLVRIFSNDFLPLALARNAGMLALELLPAGRRLLAQQAMGLAAPVSRLGRGLPLESR